MKSIKDIVNTLSEEEKELFQDLIEECLLRESQVTASGEKTTNNLQRLTELSEIMTTNLDIILDAFKEMSQQNDNLQEKVLENKLRSLPDEVFYNA